MDTSISRRRILGLAAGAATTALPVSKWLFSLNGKGQVIKAAAQDGTDWTPALLTKDEAEATAILSDIIIPRTNTPGARDARCHECIDLLLSIESDQAQATYRDGLAWFEDRCKATHGKGIAQATADQVTEIVHATSDEHDTHPDELKPGVVFFKNLKDRTIFAYYTSREGHVEELGRAEHIGMETFRGCSHRGIHQ